MANLLKAKELAGTGLLTQLKEILTLRFSESQLGISEYFDYRLFDRSIVSRERREFAGFRRERDIDRRLNADVWRAIANDKAVMYAVLHGLGLPYPSIRALCHFVDRHFRDVPCLRSAAEIREFLQRTDCPLFVKPVVGSYGRGALSLLGYDSNTEALRLGNGELWSLTDAAETFLAGRSYGFLFQEMVRPHESIRSLCLATASSVRVVIVRGPRGYEIFRCAWKIPVGRNMTDNFVHGEAGNLLGLVDVDSGRVLRVITGTGFRMAAFQKHPENDQALVGFELPQWSRLKELCLTAAANFPGLRLQHWDVAVGQSGPVILELNVEGSMDFHQLAGTRGILNGVLTEALVGDSVGRR